MWKRTSEILFGRAIGDKEDRQNGWQNQNKAKMRNVVNEYLGGEK